MPAEHTITPWVPARVSPAQAGDTVQAALPTAAAPGGSLYTPPPPRPRGVLHHPAPGDGGGRSHGPPPGVGGCGVRMLRAPFPPRGSSCWGALGPVSPGWHLAHPRDSPPPRAIAPPQPAGPVGMVAGRLPAAHREPGCAVSPGSASGALSPLCSPPRCPGLGGTDPGRCLPRRLPANLLWPVPAPPAHPSSRREEEEEASAGRGRLWKEREWERDRSWGLRCGAGRRDGRARLGPPPGMASRDKSCPARGPRCPHAGPATEPSPSGASPAVHLAPSTGRDPGAGTPWHPPASGERSWGLAHAVPPAVLWDGERVAPGAGLGPVWRGGRGDGVRPFLELLGVMGIALLPAGQRAGTQRGSAARTRRLRGSPRCWGN